MGLQQVSDRMLIFVGISISTVLLAFCLSVIAAAIVVVSHVAELLKSQFECHLPFVVVCVENLLRDLIDRESGKQSSNSLLHSLCSLEVCSHFLSVLLFS